MSASARKTCRACVGTGWILLNNSWFTFDGYRRTRCYFCDGGFQPDAEYARALRQKRAKVAEWGGLRPPETSPDHELNVFRQGVSR